MSMIQARSARALAGKAQPSRAAQRLKELDALRGLTACTVVFCHFYNLRAASDHSFLVQWICRRVFRFIVAGHEAVILFFVLSGFVLTIPYLNPEKPGYLPFLVKRICRIWLPYLGAVGLAVLGDSLFRNHISGLSHWFQIIWSRPVTWTIVAQHVALVGDFDQMQLNGAFWSLVVEMRISLIFPLLMILLSRICTPSKCLTVGVMAFVLGSLPDMDVAALSTAHFLMVFMIGSLLARSRSQCAEIYLRLSRVHRASFGLLTLGFWSFAGVIGGHPGLSDLSDMTLAVAAGVFIVVAMAERKIKAVLLRQVPQFLGRISYSLYLLHVSVLLSLVHALYPEVSLYTLFPIYLLLTVVASVLFYKAAEEPAMRLGKWLDRKMHISAVRRQLRSTTATG